MRPADLWAHMDTANHDLHHDIRVQEEESLAWGMNACTQAHQPFIMHDQSVVSIHTIHDMQSRKSHRHSCALCYSTTSIRDGSQLPSKHSTHINNLLSSHPPHKSSMKVLKCISHLAG